MSRLEVSLLGSPSVRLDGNELSFRTRKVLGLLAYLALEGGVQTRDRLAGLFWPDAEPEAGRNSLRNTLSYLREALGGEEHLRIERQAVGLKLEGEVVVDALELERAAKLALEPREVTFEQQLGQLESASSLYRGEFMAGFSIGDEGEFDAWVSERREVARRHAQTVLERLSKLQSDAGQPDNAIETASRLIALDRLNEAGYRVLIGLQHASGDRAGAIQTFEGLQHTLRVELDLEPTPETIALIERVRLETPEASSRAPRVPSLPTMLLEGRMVGRVAEFVKLVEAYHASAHGQTRVVTISGEPGIGKTRLAQEFLTWATSQGASLLRGRAFETGGGLAYQPVTDALRRFFRTEPDPTGVLRPVWLGELSTLLPELLERVPNLPEPTANDAVARTRLFEAVTRLGLNLAARKAVVLFVDDLQWADQVSLELLGYAARRWLEEASPVLIVFTVRAEALGQTPLQAWLTALGREVASVTLELGSLSVEDTARLVEAVGGANPAFSSWLFRETGGQPLFITETLKSLSERGLIVPHAGQWRVQLETMNTKSTVPGVRSVIQARLARLSSDAHAILEAGAVLGQGFDAKSFGVGFDFGVVTAMADLEERAALRALDELLRSRLILESGNTYVFSHDKIRETAEEDAGEARRRVYHRRAFEALSKTNAAHFARASHAIGARMWLEAYQQSVLAGDEAAKVYAWRASLEHYQRARTILRDQPDGVDVTQTETAHDLILLYSKINNCLQTLNEAAAIADIPSETLALARRIDNPWLEGHALRFQAEWIALDDHDEFERLLAQAEAMFKRLDDREGLFTIEIDRIHDLRINTVVPYRDGIARLEQLLPLAYELGGPYPGWTLNSLADFSQNHGDWQQAALYWREGIAHRKQTRGRGTSDAYHHENLGFSLLNLGDVQSALPELHAAHRIKIEMDDNPVWIGMAAAYRSYGLLESGDLVGAHELMTQTFAQVEHAHPRFATEFCYALGFSHLCAGRYAEARAALQTGLNIIDAPANNDQNVWIRVSPTLPQVMRIKAAPEGERKLWGGNFAEFVESMMCAAFALEGDWSGALGHARNAVQLRLRTNNERGLHAPRLKHWLEVEALLRGGETELARESVRRLEAAVQDGERLEIPVLRARAVLEAWDGRTDASLRLLEKAQAIAARIGLPLELRSLEQAIAEIQKKAKGSRVTRSSSRR